MPEQPKRPLLTRTMRRAHGILSMNFGRAGSLAPLSKDWGFDRGTAVDRYYIERFLDRHSQDIRGDVLEIAGDSYSMRFGGDNVFRQHILDLDAANPRATIIGDLADPATLPAESFDCILVTQTFQYIFDLRAAVTHIRKALRTGGVALITVPGITPVDRGRGVDDWYWSLTESALRRLLSGPFEAGGVSVESFGNLYAATAFLHGAAIQELSRSKLNVSDQDYPVTVAARAIA